MAVTDTTARFYGGAGANIAGITPPGNRTNTYAELDLLERARPQLVLDLGADMKLMPMNKADNVTFRRAVNAIVSTVAATEGVTPASRALAYEDVNGILLEYAEVFEITSRMDELGEDKAVRDSADVLADLVANTKEAVAWAAYIVGTNAVFAGAASIRTEVGAPAGLGDLQTATRSLMAAKAQRFTTVQNGGLNDNTYPIEAAFYAFCHTDLQPNIRNIPGFRTCAEYGGKSIVSEYEFGSVENVRFLCTPQLTPVIDSGADPTGLNIKSEGGALADVYPIIVCGKHALGSVDLKGTGAKGFGGAKLNVLTGADKADPTNARSYVAVRWYDLKLILNNEWVVRIESACTDDLSLLNP